MNRKFIVDEAVLRKLDLISFSDGIVWIGNPADGWYAIREIKEDE